MNSQKTPHTSPFRASYGVSFMSTSTEIDRVIKGFYCTCNCEIPWSYTCVGFQIQCMIFNPLYVKFLRENKHIFTFSGLDIKHLVYMPVGHVVLKIYGPCKNFHVPSQYLCKPCKAYVHCWENKYMPRLKNHLPCRARNHKSLCALRQDLHAPGMRARLNVDPWFYVIPPH